MEDRNIFPFLRDFVVIRRIPPLQQRRTEGAYVVRFGVCSGDETFRGTLFHAIDIWKVSVCHDIDWSVWISWEELLAAQEAAPCRVLFVDVGDQTAQLKAMTERPENGSALFICSDSHRAAIDSYALHPDGFLPRQITPEALERALSRCSPLWSDELSLLFVSVGRSRVGLPLCELIWAEANGGRSCVLHSSHGQVTAGEPLMELVERLPSNMFFRCQKSFLVNLRHVCSIQNHHFIMSDSTEIPIGRNHRTAAEDKYTAFCTRWTGQLAASH